MLTDVARLAAFGIATPSGGAAGTHARLAASALDQTLVAWPAAREAPLLVLSGMAFGAAPADGEPQVPGALLDNGYASELANELLVARGLFSTQPHGVLFAEDGPLLAGIKAARDFVVGESLAGAIVIAVAADAAVSLSLSCGPSSGIVVRSLRRARPGDRPSSGGLADRGRALVALAASGGVLELAEGQWAAELESEGPCRR